MNDVIEAAKLAALTGAAVVVAAALSLRGRPSWPERHPRATGTLTLLAMLTGAAGYVIVLSAVFDSLPRHPILAGVAIGWVFGGIPVALTLPVILFLATVDRASLPKIEDPAVFVWTSLAGVCGFAVFGVLLLQLLTLLRWSGGWAFLLVPVGVALFPMVRQIFWAPALLTALRRRERRLEPPYAAALRRWADEIAAGHRIEKLQVLFGPAKHANAAAIGFWPFTRFIMIGDGLTSVMPEPEARAVLAHEIAHVLRADVRRQTLLWVGLASLWVYIWTAMRISLDLGGPWWAMASGIGIGGVAYVSGRYSRHCELATDRLAAELTGDPAAMASALTVIASIMKIPADRRFPTHPSLNERLRNLLPAS